MQRHRSAIEKETFEESLFFCLYTILFCLRFALDHPCELGNCAIIGALVGGIIGSNALGRLRSDEIGHEIKYAVSAKGLTIGLGKLGANRIPDDGEHFAVVGCVRDLLTKQLFIIRNLHVLAVKG